MVSTSALVCSQSGTKQMQVSFLHPILNDCDQAYLIEHHSYSFMTRKWYLKTKSDMVHTATNQLLFCPGSVHYTCSVFRQVRKQIAHFKMKGRELIFEHSKDCAIIYILDAYRFLTMFIQLMFAVLQPFFVVEIFSDGTR